MYAFEMRSVQKLDEIGMFDEHYAFGILSLERAGSCSSNPSHASHSSQVLAFWMELRCNLQNVLQYEHL